MSGGYQTQVYNQPAQAIAGDFASANPRSTSLAAVRAAIGRLCCPAYIGNVRSWHFPDVAISVRDVCSWGQSRPLCHERRLPKMTLAVL